MVVEVVRMSRPPPAPASGGQLACIAGEEDCLCDGTNGHRRVQVCDLNPWVYLVTTLCANDDGINNIKRGVHVANVNPQ